MAWDGWRAADQPAEKVGFGTSMARYFRRGLGEQLAEPKGYCSLCGGFPGFLAPSAPLASTLTLTAIYVAVATAVHRLIATIAGAARDWVGNTGHAVQVRRVLSLTLVGVAAWVLWQTRSRRQTGR